MHFVVRVSNRVLIKTSVGSYVPRYLLVGTVQPREYSSEYSLGTAVDLLYNMYQVLTVVHVECTLGVYYLRPYEYNTILIDCTCTVLQY